MCCNYCMSYLFKYKKLIEYNKEANEANEANGRHSNNMPQPQQHTTTDADTLTVSTLNTNLDEFKVLFLTQEKLCYELRSDNAILKNKLEISTSISNKRLQKIKKLQTKICKLEAANVTFEKILGHSNQHINVTNNAASLQLLPPPPPPPPPPPLLLPIGIKQTLPPPKPNSMNNVLEEFKSKFTPKD